MDSYYKTLGVARNASPDEISQAYHTLAKKYHPDKNPSDPEAARKFDEATKAFEILRDASKREASDFHDHHTPHTTNGPAQPTTDNQVANTLHMLTGMQPIVEPISDTLVGNANRYIFKAHANPDFIKEVGGLLIPEQELLKRYMELMLKPHPLGPAGLTDPSEANKAISISSLEHPKYGDCVMVKFHSGILHWSDEMAQRRSQELEKELLNLHGGLEGLLHFQQQTNQWLEFNPSEHPILIDSFAKPSHKVDVNSVINLPNKRGELGV